MRNSTRNAAVAFVLVMAVLAGGVRPSTASPFVRFAKPSYGVATVRVAIMPGPSGRSGLQIPPSLARQRAGVLTDLAGGASGRVRLAALERMPQSELHVAASGGPASKGVALPTPVGPAATVNYAASNKSPFVDVDVSARDGEAARRLAENAVRTMQSLFPEQDSQPDASVYGGVRLAVLGPVAATKVTPRPAFIRALFVCVLGLLIVVGLGQRIRRRRLGDMSADGAGPSAGGHHSSASRTEVWPRRSARSGVLRIETFNRSSR